MLKALLVEIIGAPEVYKKIIGMQMLVEGLAMGAFATFFTQTNDPLMKKLMQLVMTDEAFHHKFGKIWADRTVPKLEPEEHWPSSRTGRRTASRPCCSTWSPRISKSRNVRAPSASIPDVVIAGTVKSSPPTKPAART